MSKRRKTKSKKGSNKNALVFVVLVIAIVCICAALNKPKAEAIKDAQNTQNDCKTEKGVKTCLSYY